MCVLLEREPNHELRSPPSVDRGTRGAVDNNSMKPGGVHAQIGNNAILPDQYRLKLMRKIGDFLKKYKHFFFTVPDGCNITTEYLTVSNSAIKFLVIILSI